MSIYEEKLWTELERKVRISDEQNSKDCQIANAYIEGIRKICQYGIDRSKTIRDTFPLYTLHDEVHIVNVMRLMWNLLDSHIENLTRDEVAMLIVSAYCHDIGMSYSEDEKEAVLKDYNRLSRYLEKNKSEYVEAFSDGTGIPKLTENMKQNYLRYIHHERAEELLRKFEWPDVLYGKLICRDVIAVCQSHGKDISFLGNLRPTTTIDLRLCAILLRLSDILDFDAKRAPQAIYEYSGFVNKNDTASKYSEEEWIKHLSSNGFDFQNITDRNYPYELEYYAVSRSMQIEQAIHKYIDWVDIELTRCRQQLDCYAGRHRNFVLPRKIRRHIEPNGYMSGEYRLTLDQGQVLDLLVGRNLYQDPAVFVRELLQNAIDAVRTREKLDRNLPGDWSTKINISSWMDSEGYHWFRIEDNGIGMTEKIIRNFFLKIGRSYYNSDEFLQAKLRCKADPGYMPISRFGIGILSCFMGDERRNLVEISTKHFGENGQMCPSLRMKMSGLRGYYYLASSEEYHEPGEMYGRSTSERKPYLLQPGTAIAVRTNLYQTGKYRGFKEIVDQYVVYPPVPIHYEGDEGSFDYPTEKEFLSEISNIQYSDDISKIGLLNFPLSDEQIRKIQASIPDMIFSKKPTLKLRCVPLASFTKSPNLFGAILLADVSGNAEEVELDIGGEKVNADVKIEVFKKYSSNTIGIRIELVFPKYFQEQMEIAKRKQEMFRKGEIKHRLNRKYNNKRLMREIVDAIVYGHYTISGWKEQVMYDNGISMKDLNLKIEQVIKEVANIIGITSNDKEMFKRLYMFKRLEKEWKFELCNLEDYEWFIKYFLLVEKYNDTRSIAAHNGIYCGNADFFCCEWPSSQTLGAIVLLKDKYRPMVDVSRDKIRKIPIEVACDLEMMRKQLKRQGFIFEGKQGVLDDNYSHISVREYVELINLRPDFIERLFISTDKGELSVDVLEEKIRQGERIEFTGIPRLKSRGYGIPDMHLSDYLCAAYLRNKYTLRLEISQYNSKIFIESKKEEINDENIDFFPPTFFISTDKETKYLTCRNEYQRKGCNVSHRLSKFIISNVKQLQYRVPGLFVEMLRSLAEDDAARMISVVNDLLGRLRSLPDIGIAVPTDLKLSEKDFAE